MAENWLDQLVGEWTFESRSVPDEARYRRTGTEIVTRQGVWVVIEPVVAESGEGSRFQLALDPETGRVAGDFVHWADSTLWTYEGGVEPDGRLHLKSRGPSFDVEGEMTDYDDVFEVAGPDERRMTGRLVGPDGQWRDFMIADYRRKTSTGEQP